MKNNKNKKEFEVYRNGTHHATIFAQNMKEAKNICLSWYGCLYEIYEAETNLND